jgi:hypothetical protein
MFRQASDRLCVGKYRDDDSMQQWQYNRDRDVIENLISLKRVLEVYEGAKCNGAVVCVNDHNGRFTQRWRLECL